MPRIDEHDGIVDLFRTTGTSPPARTNAVSGRRRLTTDGGRPGTRVDLSSAWRCSSDQRSARRIWLGADDVLSHWRSTRQPTGSGGVCQAGYPQCRDGHP